MVPGGFPVPLAGRSSCAPRIPRAKLSSGWKQRALTPQSRGRSSCVGVPWHTLGSNNLILIMKPELCKSLHQAWCIPLTGMAGRREFVCHSICCADVEKRK